MANATVSGVNGVVSIDSTEICAQEWSISFNTAHLDGTGFCDVGVAAFVSGKTVITWTASSTDYIAVDGTVATDFVLTTSSVSGITFTGTALINHDHSTPHDGMVTHTYTATATGAVVIGATGGA